MAVSIVERKLCDGRIVHTVQVRVYKNREVVYSQAQTFERRAAAEQWARKHKEELRKHGATEKFAVVDPTLGEVIAEYLNSLKKGAGKTKRQVLNAIKRTDLGRMRCSRIKSQDIVDFAGSLKAKPQTVANYLSHLDTVFKLARPAWGYPLDHQTCKDARMVAKHLGLISRSRDRDRRPSLEELNMLLEHFSEKERRDRRVTPMTALILFAIFSTRRQAEICRIRWEDLDEKDSEVMVRDMKHPGEKEGNDVITALSPEALAIIKRQRKATKQDKGIFPFNAGTVSRHFTDACKLLGIEDLHFHDLRHEGISWLFELGWNIPNVASVSGHRTWESLKRYSHIKKKGDKYDGWPWITDIRKEQQMP